MHTAAFSRVLLIGLFSASGAAAESWKTPILTITPEQGTPFALNLRSHVRNPQNAPLVFVLHSGRLPLGFALNRNGVLSGLARPSTARSGTFRVRWANFPPSSKPPLTLRYAVLPQPAAWTVSEVTLAPAFRGSPYSVDLSPYYTNPANQPLVFTALNAPEWITISPVGRLSGTVSAWGDVDFPIRLGSRSLLRVKFPVVSPCVLRVTGSPGTLQTVSVHADGPENRAHLLPVSGGKIQLPYRPPVIYLRAIDEGYWPGSRVMVGPSACGGSSAISVPRGPAIKPRRAFSDNGTLRQHIVDCNSQSRCIGYLDPPNRILGYQMSDIRVWDRGIPNAVLQEDIAAEWDQEPIRSRLQFCSRPPKAYLLHVTDDGDVLFLVAASCQNPPKTGGTQLKAFLVRYGEQVWVSDAIALNRPGSQLATLKVTGHAIESVHGEWAALLEVTSVPAGNARYFVRTGGAYHTVHPTPPLTNYRPLAFSTDGSAVYLSHVVDKSLIAVSMLEFPQQLSSNTQGKFVAHQDGQLLGSLGNVPASWWTPYTAGNDISTLPVNVAYRNPSSVNFDSTLSLTTGLSVYGYFPQFPYGTAVFAEEDELWIDYAPVPWRYLIPDGDGMYPSLYRIGREGLVFSVRDGVFDRRRHYYLPY